MKPRKLKLVAKVAGFPTAIAEVHIQNFASEPELKDYTELVCPSCLEPTEYHPASYECKKCGQTFSWWGKLVRVIKGTKVKIDMPRLLKEKEVAVGELYKMKRNEFAKYCDAVKSEKGLIVEDGNSAHNLFKLLVATEKLGYVIIVLYKDTYEEVVGLLKVSDSGRIKLQEIIPINLVKIKESLMLNRDEITEKDVEEAGQFVEQFIPVATEEKLKVHDYRTAWVEQHVQEQPEKEAEKVVQLKEIMAMAKKKSA